MTSPISAKNPAFDNLMHQVNIQNPFPLYDWLRVHSPVHWNQHLGSWMLTRFEDVRAALADPVRFSSDSGEPIRRRAEDLPASARESFDIGYRFFYRQIQAFDAPVHTAHRSLISKAFTPGMMVKMRGAIESRVEGLIDDLTAAETGDFVSHFAYPLPSLVIFDLLGVPGTHYQALRTSAAAFARFLPAVHTGNAEALEDTAIHLLRTEALLLDLIAERRVRPQNDLISALAILKDGTSALEDRELVVLCNFLLFAGHETTANLLAGSVLHLLQDRRLWNQLQQSPDLITNAVEELLRFVSPVLTLGRILTEEYECRGTSMRKGDRISVVIGAANHDPDEFDAPERLQLDRPKAHSVAFGHGIHYCVGAALARLETQVALSALLRRLPNMRLTTSDVEYQPIFFLRSLKSLPVSVR